MYFPRPWEILRSHQWCTPSSPQRTYMYNTQLIRNTYWKLVLFSGSLNLFDWLRELGWPPSKAWIRPGWPFHCLAWGAACPKLGHPQQPQRAAGVWGWVAEASRGPHIVSSLYSTCSSFLSTSKEMLNSCFNGTIWLKIHWVWGKKKTMGKFFFDNLSSIKLKLNGIPSFRGKRE